MNFRKNSTLIIGCGLAGVLLIVAIVFLIRNQGQYQDSLSALENSRNRLAALNNRQPYPSAENVSLAGKNLELVQEKFTEVHGSIQRSQIKTENIEPARFAPLLEEASRRLRSKSAESGVSVPVELGLGFRDYAAGKLPPNDPVVMERLVLQVKAVEDLIGLMVDAKVQSIDLIQRDEFETKRDATPDAQVDVRGRGRGVPAGRPEVAPSAQVGGLPMAPPNELYQIERFTIAMTGWESAIWEVLNRIASRKVVYVLADVAMENTKTDLGKPVDMKARLAALTASIRQPGQLGAGLPPPTLESISRDERIVGGREPIKAKIVVDMYRFPDVASEGAQP